MDTEKNQRCLDVLNIVLSDNVPRGYFSLYGYSEEAVCLEQDGSHWNVFNGERNNKNELKAYDNALEASLEITVRLSHYCPNLKSMFLETLL